MAHVLWKNKTNPPAPLAGPHVPGAGRHVRIFLSNFLRMRFQ
nr:MAG TPA: hypothetical protein [Caudoviricetes sp.]